MNYFTLFNVPEKFKIDKILLSKNFYTLQLKFHPDLFVTASILKKKIVLEKSIEINKGYKILNNFLSRAIYLLSLHGIKIKKETLLLNDNNFLIKHFSLYEELDNLKEKNCDKNAFNKFFNKIQKRIEKYENGIEIEFKNKNFEKVITIISKLLFFKKLKINLKKEKNI